MMMFFYLAIWKQNRAQSILLPKYPVNHIGNNDDSLVSVGTGPRTYSGTGSQSHSGRESPCASDPDLALASRHGSISGFTGGRGWQGLAGASYLGDSRVWVCVSLRAGRSGGE